VKYVVMVSLTMTDELGSNFRATVNLNAKDLDLVGAARLIDMIKFAFEDANKPLS
jgi:hypothetical protein